MWWLLACGQAPVPVDRPVSGSDSPIVSVDSPAPPDELPGGGDSGATEDDPACSSVFDAPFATWSLTFADGAWADLEYDYTYGLKDYHPATLTVGDEALPVQVRLKGNPSFSWFQAKMQFVVAFDQDDPDARFHGLRKLAFDAPWYDASMLKDRLGWAVIRAAGGLPDACTTSVQLDVDGAEYGAYTLIEYFDHEWLERNFGKADAGGTLWKYGSEVEANPEAADPWALADLGTVSSVADMEQLGPVDEWAEAWAAEAVLGDDDGYWCCDHNFYVYDHPTQGLVFVDWDLDDAFDVDAYDTDPVAGYPQLWGLFDQTPFVLLTADPDGRARYRTALRTIRAALDPDVLQPELDAWAADLADSVAADPTRPYTAEEHDEAVTRLGAWVRARGASIDAWLSCDEGTPDDGDGDGYDDCSDPDDGDATIHPGAAEVCNGVDDDADGVVDDDDACDDCTSRSFEGRSYAFCRRARTYDDAVALCAERGLAPLSPATTADSYYLYFYTWPVEDAWWLAKSGGSCQGYAVMSAAVTTLSCAELHPVVCASP